jgi:hypothetical protein
VQITKETYASLHSSRRRKPNWIRLSLWFAGTVALTLHPATRWLGIPALLLLLLVGLIASFVMPWMTAHILRWQYDRDRLHLHQPITCGVSEEDVWIRGGDFVVRFPWGQMSGWNQGGGWLWIAGTGGGVAYFQIESLRKAGVFEELVALARALAVEGQFARR